MYFTILIQRKKSKKSILKKIAWNKSRIVQFLRLKVKMRKKPLKLFWNHYWFMHLGFNKFDSIAEFFYNFRTTCLSCIVRMFNDVTLADIILLLVWLFFAKWKNVLQKMLCILTFKGKWDANHTCLLLITWRL